MKAQSRICGVEDQLFHDEYKGLNLTFENLKNFTMEGPFYVWYNQLIFKIQTQHTLEGPEGSSILVQVGKKNGKAK